MAPIRDTTRRDVLLALGNMPTMGPHLSIFFHNVPVARVTHASGQWTLSSLALNAERAHRAFEASSDHGAGVRPEGYWPYYEPAHRIVTASSLKVFRIALKLGPWPPRGRGLRWSLAGWIGWIFG